MTCLLRDSRLCAERSSLEHPKSLNSLVLRREWGNGILSEQVRDRWMSDDLGSWLAGT